MVPTERVLNRVRGVKLEHFRGFIGSQYDYDTDADLVLLLGPNGRGKTAFVEALQLLLTGVPMTRERAGKATYDYSTLLALHNKGNHDEAPPVTSGSFSVPNALFPAIMPPSPCGARSS